ncbi:hypothetical protein [Mycoplasmopsis alligatoris]|uniref:Uncharacterized protein n=1 Tax=Mycoplasmopsis alligatoris A21JP2 TaxID=747682 RepID=D4XWB7_9BACT|nr:hypothetical protein [Mycoplasmopsis alligatoris]EFF41192.1 hypothetical protein MALL_0514 [Mycoplasmopsis alligatoris A21JP2]
MLTNSNIIINKEPNNPAQDLIIQLNKVADVLKPEISVPIIFVIILLIGFLLGFLLGILRSAVALVVIPSVVIICSLIFSKFLNANIETILADVVGKEFSTTPEFKTASQLIIKIVTPLVAAICLLLAYFIFGLAVAIISIIGKLKPKKSKKVILSRILGALIGIVAAVPSAVLISNVINFSKRADNDFTNKFLNPLVKITTINYGIGLGKNLTTITDLLEKKDVLKLIFLDPNSLSGKDKTELVDKTVNVLNNPEFSDQAANIINKKIDDEVKKVIEKNPAAKITEKEIEAVIKADTSKLKINDKPVDEILGSLNIKDKLNETGKESATKIVTNIVDKYTDKNVDPKLKTKLINSIIDKYIGKVNSNDLKNADPSKLPDDIAKMIPGGIIPSKAA